jgi:curved DNA-binding protein CbpA
MAYGNPDPYLILGVPPASTQTEITHAYRARLRAHHPDTRSPLSSHTADERLQQVLAAYALLRDPARRADYDRATEVTADAANTGPHNPTVPPAAVHPSGPVQIPITYRHNKTATTPAPAPPLWAGPVRRHQ